jgi:hypothetical protein
VDEPPTATARNAKEESAPVHGRMVRRCGPSKVTRAQALRTHSDAGFPEIECDSRIGFLARSDAKTIVALLNREIGNIVALPDVKEQLVKSDSSLLRTLPQKPLSS